MNLEKMYYHTSVKTSAIEYRGDPERWNAWAENHLRQNMAQLLIDEKSEFIRHTDGYDSGYVERLLDLYIATPKEFWAIVNRKAEEIAMRFLR